jgi:predicted enzyme related to lactoylglutathione lyase
MPDEPVPYWLTYFGVGALGQTLAQLEQLGGRKLVGPQSIGEAGELAVVEDPQGAVFALYSGRFDD